MDKQSAGSIPKLILPLAIRIFALKYIDLYNKSRMRGDFQVRFCERLGLKCPCLLDYSTLATMQKKQIIGRISVR